MLDKIIAALNRWPYGKPIKKHQVKAVLWDAGLSQEEFDHLRAEFLSYEDDDNDDEIEESATQ